MTTAPLVAERVVVRILTAPVDEMVPMSFGRLHHRQACVVEVHAGGLTGIGESWINYPAWGPAERVATLCEGVAPLLLGHDVGDPVVTQRRLLANLLPIGRQWGAPGPVWQAVSAVDVALWDIRGKAAGQPLHRILADERGAQSLPVRTRVPAYASGVGPTLVSELTDVALERGYRALKVKVGFDPDTDRATLRDVRRIVGSDLPVFADANQAWDLQTAIRRCDLLADHAVAWLEEGVDGDRLDDLEVLHTKTSMCLATGENLYGPDSFERYVASPAVSIIQPDIAKAGGLTQASHVAASASSNDTQVAPHCYSSSLGVAAMLQLAGAFPAVTWLEHDVRRNLLQSDLLTEPLTLTDGSLTIPTAPGLGVTVSPDAIARFQTHVEERTTHDF